MEYHEHKEDFFSLINPRLIGYYFRNPSEYWTKCSPGFKKKRESINSTLISFCNDEWFRKILCMNSINIPGLYTSLGRECLDF